MKELTQSIAKTVFPDGRERTHVNGTVTPRFSAQRINQWMSDLHILASEAFGNLTPLRKEQDAKWGRISDDWGSIKANYQGGRI